MDDRPIVEAMIRYGGSFVHDLGLLFLRADEDNRARLRAAFPDLWTEYADVARLHAARQAARRVYPPAVAEKLERP